MVGSETDHSIQQRLMLKRKIEEGCMNEVGGFGFEEIVVHRKAILVVAQVELDIIGQV